MVDINTVVQITITKDTATVSRVGFGTPAMLTYHTAFPQLARSFANIDEVIQPTGPFLAGSREVAIATAMFAQNPRPSRIVMLRRATAPLRDVTVTPVTDATAGKPFNLFDYEITLGDGVNLETFTFTSDADAVVAEIVAGLVALINAGTVDVLATDNATDLQIQSANGPGGAPTAGVPFTMEIDRSLMTQDDATADPGIVADLAAARAVNDEWYGLVSDANGEAEINSLATSIETLKKIYIAESADDDVPTVVVDDVASDLQTSALERTGLMWNTKPHTSPGGAWLGKQLPTDPGSTTWKFKTLATIAVDDIRSDEQGFLDGKNANYYAVVAGINITFEGTAGSGEFIDTVRGTDWLESRMQERIFTTFARNPKISLDDLGIQTIVNDVEGQLREGVSVTFLASDPAFVVTFPRASEVDPTSKGIRLLPDIFFTATLAGAVHKTTIAGRVSV